MCCGTETVCQLCCSQSLPAVFVARDTCNMSVGILVDGLNGPYLWSPAAQSPRPLPRALARLMPGHPDWLASCMPTAKLSIPAGDHHAHCTVKRARAQYVQGCNQSRRPMCVHTGLHMCAYMHNDRDTGQCTWSRGSIPTLYKYGSVRKAVLLHTLDPHSKYSKKYYVIMKIVTNTFYRECGQGFFQQFLR